MLYRWKSLLNFLAVAAWRWLAAAGCGSALCLFCLSYLYVTQTQSFPPHNAQCQIYTSPSPPHTTTTILHTDLQGRPIILTSRFIYNKIVTSFPLFSLVLSASPNTTFSFSFSSINWFQWLTKCSMAGQWQWLLVFVLVTRWWWWCVQMKQKTGRVCQAAIKTFGRIYTEILWLNGFVSNIPLT